MTGTMGFVLAVLAGGCAAPGLGDPTLGASLDGVRFDRQGEVLPDFTLVDTNATSPTAGGSVSVSDQRGRVSAWYFGHST